MRSSYIQHNYGEIFKAIIRGFQPRTCVELGVLDGYSTIHIGLALKRNGGGTLRSVDLFDDYQFKHGNQEAVQDLIEEYGLEQIVKLDKNDAYNVAAQYMPCSVDFLHVDISNTGDTLAKIMEQWDEKMVQGGVICFEGGSEERDQFDWMVKYNMKPIKPELENNAIIRDKYIFGTYLKFPSMTMLLKKR